jgi:acetyl esterase/lipase
MVWVLCIVFAATALWAAGFLLLRGENLSRYEGRVGPVSKARPIPSEQHRELLAWLQQVSAEAAPGRSRRQKLDLLRERLDSMGETVDLAGVHIRPVAAEGLRGEWVLADGAEADRRLLYLHGGAFCAGSPRSHRAITTRLSKVARAAVLAVDYRLMPEHRRLDCLADCQAAYRWIIANGPQGSAPAETLFVAGDSAGGNLTLAILAWVRDHGLRAADAAVVLSPVTDATRSGASFARNVHSDPILGPVFGHIARMPRGLFLWLAWFTLKARPCDPRVSPIHGELQGLPPLLVHASEAEMLFDDARRYVNKAIASGSQARLETWPHTVHVWHIFVQDLPEAQEAFAGIGEFLGQFQ